MCVSIFLILQLVHLRAYSAYYPLRDFFYSQKKQLVIVLGVNTMQTG